MLPRASLSASMMIAQLTRHRMILGDPSIVGQKLERGESAASGDDGVFALAVLDRFRLTGNFRGSIGELAITPTRFTSHGPYPQVSDR
jgi:hypothetical protein